MIPLYTYLDEIIQDIKLDPDTDILWLDFGDVYKIKIWDDGQSCCEARYMRTDENLEDFKGAKYTGFEIRSAGDIEDPNNAVHEIEFFVIKTDRGDITFSNHNEHNGYYGGFCLEAKIVLKEEL